MLPDLVTQNHYIWPLCAELFTMTKEIWTVKKKAVAHPVIKSKFYSLKKDVFCVFVFEIKLFGSPIIGQFSP